MSLQCPVNPIDVLPNFRGIDGRCWSDWMLHPLVVESLGECLARPDVSQVVRVRPFTLRDASLAIRHMLPPLWLEGTSVSVAWQDGMQASLPTLLKSS